MSSLPRAPRASRHFSDRAVRGHSFPSRVDVHFGHRRRDLNNRNCARASSSVAGLVVGGKKRERAAPHGSKRPIQMRHKGGAPSNDSSTVSRFFQRRKQSPLGLVKRANRFRAWDSGEISIQLLPRRNKHRPASRADGRAKGKQREAKGAKGRQLRAGRYANQVTRSAETSRSKKVSRFRTEYGRAESTSGPRNGNTSPD